MNLVLVVVLLTLGWKFTLVVPGQHNELKLGTNVIKHILHQSML